MISGGTFPHRLTEIDDLSRPDHSYLSAADDCYFLGEYTARKGFAFSSTNQLILNLKKGMDRRDRPEWAFKGRAIRTAAEALRASLNDDARAMLTFVPIPPSKAKGDPPLHDDRLLQVLRSVWPGQATDIRELIVQPQSTDAVHDREERPTPAQIEGRYVVDRQLLQPAPQLIAVVDDVITTGAHFVAARNLLRREFADTKFVGLFIARRVPETVDVEDFDHDAP
jgi:predicted amidophosphoribosyltransferase